MNLLVDGLGPYLASLPHGEWRWPNWAADIVDARVASGNFRVVRRSRFSEPRGLRPVLDPPRLVPRGKLTPDVLALPYFADAATSYPIMKSLPKLVTGTRPQYGIPGPLDMAAFTWLRPLHHYGAEVDAAIEQVDMIRELTNGEAIYQLEIPLETVAVARAPRRLRAAVASSMAQRIREFIGSCPQNSEWIIHLCYGNKHNLPLVSPTDTSPLVELANAISDCWPLGRRLLMVHFPLGDIHNPAPYAVDFHAPLGWLTLPQEVRVAAGLVRAGASLDRHLWSLHTAERMVGRGPLVVSTSCGWSRQPEMVTETIDLLTKLAESDWGAA